MNIKKIIGYPLIGSFSALTTLGILNYLQKEESGNFTSTPTEIEQITQTADTQHAVLANNVFTRASHNPTFTSAAEKTVNAVVNVKNYSSTGRNGELNSFDFFFGFPQQRQQKKGSPRPIGHGSGVIISADGYIVTNNHVIKGAKKIEVTLNDQSTYEATLVGTDPNADIALLKIKGSNLPHLKFYNSDDIKVGEWVLAVGNPFSLNSTVTAGIVSAKGRSLNILRESDSPIESFIQTDAAINPGNSGGALVNTNGDLVGINSAISSQTGSYIGYGFAVPSNLVRKIVEDLKKYGLVQRGYIGINVLDLTNEEAVRSYNDAKGSSIKTQQGTLVTGFSKNGGAINSGIEKGDIIKSINGRAVKSQASLSLLIGSKHPGDHVDITILRNGKERTYKVELKDAEGRNKTRSLSDLSAMERLGVKFEPLTAKQKQRLGTDHGLQVVSLKSTSKLKKIGIREGYVVLKINDKKMNTLKEVETALNKTKTISIRFVDRYGRIYTGGLKMD